MKIVMFLALIVFSASALADMTIDNCKVTTTIDSNGKTIEVEEANVCEFSIAESDKNTKLAEAYKSCECDDKKPREIAGNIEAEGHCADDPQEGKDTHKYSVDSEGGIKVLGNQ